MIPSHTANMYYVKTKELKEKLGIPEDEDIVTASLFVDEEKTQFMIIEATKGSSMITKKKISGGY